MVAAWRMFSQRPCKPCYHPERRHKALCWRDPDMGARGTAVLQGQVEGHWMVWHLVNFKWRGWGRAWGALGPRGSYAQKPWALV